MNTFIIIAILLFSVIFAMIYSITRHDQTDKNIMILFRQCARWSTAATQDTNPIIANLHANYAAGYLWALSDLYTPEQITKITRAVTGIDYATFKSEIQKNQDITTQQLVKACPKFTTLPNNASKIIATIAGEQ